MSRITTNGNPRGDLDLPQTKLQIPSGTPHLRSTTVQHPPHHGWTWPGRVGECRVNLDTWGHRSFLMPKSPAIIAPKRSN